MCLVVGEKQCRLFSSVDEQDSSAWHCGQVVGHLTDSGVVDESSKEKHEAHHQKDPPQPVLSVEVTGEICGEPDDEDPFDEGEAEA